MPDEVVIARAARAYGLSPWALEHALGTDPSAFRWFLMAPHLDEFEATIDRADRGG